MHNNGARELARRVLWAVRAGQIFASDALAEEFSHARLSHADRALATEIAYGTLRHQTRLDRALAAATPRGALKVSPRLRIALRVAAYQLLMLDRVPDHAAVDDAVAAAKRVGGPRMAGLANGLLRRLAAAGEPPLPSELRTRVALEYSLPDWIVAQLEAAVGRDQLAVAANALTVPAPLSIRVSDVADRDAVAEALTAERPGVVAEPVADAPWALRVTGLGDPATTSSFRAGRWTVQDVASQRVAALLAPQAGQCILDACAGVGGKATHLAQLAPEAHIDAADISEAKLERLRDTARRLGCSPIRTVCADVTDSQAHPDLPIDARYDAVLVDAPCSGLGVLRRHPEAKWRVQQADLSHWVHVQRRLLDALAPRAGHVLVYSVCTFTPSEGPQQIETFCQRHPRFRLDQEFTTWPHIDGADAFYAARLISCA